MLPYILAAVGGYLIGDSMKKQYADGGMMAKGGDTDGDYEFDKDQQAKAEELYDKGYDLFCQGKTKDAESLRQQALKVGSWLGWTETDLPKYSMKRKQYARGGMMADGGMITDWELKPNGRYYATFFVKKKDPKYREITEHGVTESMEETDNGYEITISVTEAGKKYFEENFNPIGFMADGGMMAKGGLAKGKKSNLKDVYSDLRSRIGGLSINEESETEIQADIRNWGNWEHDYEDYDRDEDDFEDDDSMILSKSSYKKMNEIVKQVKDKYPDVEIQWGTSEKNYIDFTILHKKIMERGGEVKVGDMVHIPAINKSGVVINIISHGKHYTVKFPDGSKIVYDKNELEKVNEFSDGGNMANMPDGGKLDLYKLTWNSRERFTADEILKAGYKQVNPKFNHKHVAFKRKNDSYVYEFEILRNGKLKYYNTFVREHASGGYMAGGGKSS